MRRYIDKYLSIIEPIQSYIYSSFISDETANNITMANNIGSKTFKPYYINMRDANNCNAVLSSYAFNDMQRSFIADISALYSVANYCDLLMRRNKQISVSEIETINNNIDNANRAIERRKFIVTRDILGFTEVWYDTFRTNEFILPKNDPLYNGYEYSHDQRNHRVTVSNRNIYRYNNNSIADIRITDRRGVTIGPSNKIHTIDYAIDDSDDTYWSEVILSDDRLAIPYKYTNNDEIDRSAVVALRIEFKGMKYINEIRLKPFSCYPIYVLGIYAVVTTNGSDTITRYIVSNNQSVDYYVHEPRYIDGSHSFFFAPCGATAVVIVLAQPHYTKSYFRLRSGKRKNYEIFNTIYNTTSILGMLDYSEFDTDADIAKTSANIVKSMVNELPSVNTGFVSIENKQKYEHYSKYEYIFGAYDISLKYNEYEDIGVIISKPIKTTAAPGQIAIYSDNSTINEYGTIEYSIIINNNEYPIVPINWNVVYEKCDSERISADKYYTRFVDGLGATYGLLHVIERDSISRYQLPVAYDSNGAFVDLSAVTTSDNMVLQYPYLPTGNASITQGNGYHSKYLDVLHNNIGIEPCAVTVTIDKFNTSDNSIVIPDVPFVDLRLIASNNYDVHKNYNSDEYVPIVVTIRNHKVEYYNGIDGNISSTDTISQFITDTSVLDRPYTFNVTDYRTNQLTYMQQFEPIGYNDNNELTVGDNYYIEYQVLGNKIYFNTNLSGASIDVTYYKIPSEFHIKARILSTIPGRVDNPPFINGYACLINYANQNISADTNEDTAYVASSDPYGCNFTIRQDYGYLHYSDDYVDVPLTTLNDPNDIVVPQVRRFYIYNTGVIRSRYKLFIRCSAIKHIDPANDMAWLLAVTGMGLSTGLTASGGHGTDDIYTTDNSAIWNANIQVFPNSVDWFVVTLDDTYIEPYSINYYDISIKPISPNHTSQLNETKLYVETFVEAIDDKGLYDQNGVLHKCRRQGTPYYVAYRGV